MIKDCSYVSGQSYFVNKYTKESQWETPTRPAERGPGGEKVSAFHRDLRIHIERHVPAHYVVSKNKNVQEGRELKINLLNGAGKEI